MLAPRLLLPGKAMHLLLGLRHSRPRHKASRYHHRLNPYRPVLPRRASNPIPARNRALRRKPMTAGFLFLRRKSMKSFSMPR